jgi:hypothetical protein
LRRLVLGVVAHRLAGTNNHKRNLPEACPPFGGFVLDKQKGPP